MAELRLVSVSGLVSPSELALGPEPILLGRAESCQVRIKGASVSREHARIRAEGGRHLIEDLGSGSGTRVNDAPVREAPLCHGDRIGIGAAILAVCRSGESPPPPPPPRSLPPQADLLGALTALLTAGAGEVPDRLARMLGPLLEAFEADRGIVFAPAAPGEWTRSSAATRPGALVRADDPVSRQLVRQVAGGTDALLLTSLEMEALKERYESVPGVLSSILAAPLPLPGGAGVLYLDSALERRHFEARDREILGAFARAAGDALAREERHGFEAERSRRMADLLRDGPGGARILGTSPAIRALAADLERAAGAEISVLVTGETGTGKELAARAIHDASPRAAGPFVPVNCAAIPGEILESELFGHEKGSFTGAAARRLGRFELAHGGTLFLDEIGDLPLPAQAKLLRALEERTITRVGGTGEIPVDFRLVAATNVDLEEAARSGRFRQDLYFRIAVFRVSLPPLRRRGEDVLLLAEAFQVRFAREFRRPAAGIDAEAKSLLLRHTWPGNVRELRNVIEQAVVREEGGLLSARALAPALGLAGPGARAPTADPAPGSGLEDFSGSLEAARREFEKRFILARLEAHGGNMQATSAGLGLSRRHLYVKCDELGIDYQSFR